MKKTLLYYITVSSKIPRVIFLEVDSIFFKGKKDSLVRESGEKYNYEIKEKL